MAAIEVENLSKAYKQVDVLKGVSFSLDKGNILALLGPNGAGKTTIIRILSTLLAADRGKVSVLGHDIQLESESVRRSIGLTGQYAAVDEYLTGKENIVMIGRLYRMSQLEADKRAMELLKEFDLLDVANRNVKTYSGGMRRRLDLAMSLIGSPPIIFLDEPTTGLDPPSRLTLWHTIRSLAEQGTTILLTTQYMEEADYLADQIIVLDNGKIIAQGTPDELKARVGAERLEIKVEETQFERAKKLARAHQHDDGARTITIIAKNGTSELKYWLQKLEKARIHVESVSLTKPTLDDVFLTLTGHKTEAVARRRK